MADLDAVLADLRECSGLRENVGLEALKSAMHRLAAHQGALSVQAATMRTAGALEKVAEIESVLDNVVSEMARLIDAATTQQQQQQKQDSRSPGHRSTPSEAEGPTEIPADDIEFDPDKDLLGHGTFASVYRARCRGQAVAVKVPHRQELTEPQQRAFRHEVTIMRRIYHPNVVMLLGACTQSPLAIVTELMCCDLEHVIHSDGGRKLRALSQRRRVRMLQDAALGMNWLHGVCQIIHRDLKPANLLLDENGRVKVADFGFSQFLRTGRARDVKGAKGTALYMAPEVMRIEVFEHRADVYSFALIGYELLTGIEPFVHHETIEALQKAVCFDHERPELPETIPTSLRVLLHQSWSPDVSQRPTFRDIVERLDECAVDCVARDDSTRGFWRRHFLRPQLLESVPWDDFASALAVEHNLPQLKLSCLQDVLAVGEPRVVTLERAASFATWFGGLWEASGTHLLRDLMQASNQLWFHGDVSREDSEARLRDRAEGTFLVRLSLRDPAQTPFTISRARGGLSAHKRVVRLSFDSAVTERLAMTMSEGTPSARTEKFAGLCEMVARLNSVGYISTPCPKQAVSLRPY